MNTRILIIVAMVVALAAPSAGVARTVPVKAHGKQVAAKKAVAKQAAAKKAAANRAAKKVVKQSEPRVLCICGPWPPSTFVPLTAEELERQIDLEMIAFSLPPIYGTLAPDGTLIPRGGVAPEPAAG